MDIRRKIKKKYKVSKDVIYKLFVKYNKVIYKVFNLLIIIVFVVIIQTFLSKLLIIKNYKMLLDAYCSKDYIQTIKYCDKLEHEKSIDINDIEIESKYNAGIVFHDNGDYDASINILSDIENYQDSANIIKDCRYNKAIIFFNNDDLERAVSILKKDISYKETKKVLKGIITKYIRKSKFKEAIEIYELKEDKYSVEQLIKKYDDYSKLISIYIDSNIVMSLDNITNKFVNNDIVINNEIVRYAKALFENSTNEDYKKTSKKALYIYDRDISENKNYKWLIDENGDWHYRIKKVR